jgi:hypothetical protein
VAAYVTKFFSPNRNDAKFKESERLLRTVPIYPNSELVDTSGASKDRVAGVGRGYKSSASYDALKQYYMDKLNALGWQYQGDHIVFDWGRDLGGRELSFQQGEFELNIQYAGEKADYGWNYAINITWKAG